ncbi:MAG: hypothetical protein Q6354_03250 [Candidatus Brocadiales bacterium]|nr:hypothetical protein [Candidatus Brocadiales bacterium]
MRPLQHILASGAFGLTVYALNREPAQAISCFLAGWLLDLDHFYDWVQNFGFNTDYTYVYNRFGTNRISRPYILLHSWEPIIGFWLLYAFYSISPLISGIFLGFTFHLALDQIFNGPKKVLLYFFTYRLIHGFDGPFLIQERLR